MTSILTTLRSGGVVEFEGVKFVMDVSDLQPGDSYIAERNTGPQLLTCARVVPWPSAQNGLRHGGWVVPVEPAYCYDIPECVKVKLAE